MRIFHWFRQHPPWSWLWILLFTWMLLCAVGIGGVIGIAIIRLVSWIGGYNASS